MENEPKPRFKVGTTMTFKITPEVSEALQKLHGEKPLNNNALCQYSILKAAGNISTPTPNIEVPLQDKPKSTAYNHPTTSPPKEADPKPEPEKKDDEFKLGFKL